MDDLDESGWVVWNQLSKQKREKIRFYKSIWIQISLLGQVELHEVQAAAWVALCIQCIKFQYDDSYDDSYDDIIWSII